jgi:lycopene cyclase domain-containing protein
MTYTWTVVLGVAGAASLDLVVLRTMMLRRKAFWTAYAIVLFCQLIVNGLLTGLRIVRYDASTIIGWRLAYAPIEDLLFGFAMVLMTLSLWVWLGRHGVQSTNRAAPAAPPTRDAATRRGRGA